MSYGESQGEKRCPMGRVREREGVIRGESGREKVSYGECKERKDVQSVWTVFCFVFKNRSAPLGKSAHTTGAPLRREGDGHISAILRVMAS